MGHLDLVAKAKIIPTEGPGAKGVCVAFPTQRPEPRGQLCQLEAAWCGMVVCCSGHRPFLHLTGSWLAYVCHSFWPLP